MRVRTAITDVVATVLLTMWYLLAVSGLDIHQDREHGQTYVVCSVAGSDCERIHPECQCHDHAPAGGACMEGEDCCSDDFRAVLSLSDGNGAGQPDLSAPVLEVPCLLSPEASVPAPAFRGLLAAHSPPPVSPHPLSLLCVLRA